MGTREEFVKACQKEVDHNSIYLWGGQGERTKRLSIADIENMETNKTNVERILKHLASIYPKGIEESRAFDCSGLVTYHLMKLGVITSDMTANGIYKMCKAIKKAELEPGDFVFKVTDGKAVHIAVYKGDGVLIEAVGRDDGVQNTKLTTKFNKYGMLEKLQ